MLDMVMPNLAMTHMKNSLIDDTREFGFPT